MFAEYMRSRLGLGNQIKGPEGRVPMPGPQTTTDQFPTPWMHQGPNQIQQPVMQPTPWMHTPAQQVQAPAMNPTPWVNQGPQTQTPMIAPTPWVNQGGPKQPQIEQFVPKPRPGPATDSFDGPEGRVPRNPYNPYTF